VDGFAAAAAAEVDVLVPQFGSVLLEVVVESQAVEAVAGERIPGIPWVSLFVGPGLAFVFLT
jgi:hypothetical protein